MTHVTCRLTAKNRDQLRNPALGNRVWASFTFTLVVRVRLPTVDSGCQVCVEYIAERRLAVAYTSLFYVLIYLLPVVVMLVAYGRVVVTLARRRPIGDSPDSRRQSRQRLQVLQLHTPSHLTGVESYTVIYAANSYTYYYRFS